jgi:hypothetical protein
VGTNAEDTAPDKGHKNILCTKSDMRIQKKESKEDERGAEGNSAFFSPSEKISIRRSL